MAQQAFLDSHVTPQGRRILAFVNGFIAEYGYSPTVREIQAHLGLASPATPHRHLEVLRERGFITWRADTYRTFVLTDKGKAMIE